MNNMLVNNSFGDLFKKAGSFPKYALLPFVGLIWVGSTIGFKSNVSDSLIYKNSGLINNIINIGTVYDVASICSKTLNKNAPFEEIVECSHQGMSAVAKQK